MKYINRYGVYIHEKVIKKFKEKNPNHPIFSLIEKFITVTKHGTMCRGSLKEFLEEKNSEGKNKDYSKGLNLGSFKKPREIKKALRYQEINKLNEATKGEKEVSDSKRRLKKLVLLERGR